MTLNNFLVALISLFFFTACSRYTAQDLQTGDLIFQDLDCGELCDAIEEVTEAQFHVKGPALSHVGIVIKQDGDTSLLEAYGGKVTLTPLKDVLARKQNNQPRIVRATALKGLPSDFGERLKAIEKEYLGVPYDDVFAWDNRRYYCSELVADIFNRIVGREYFAPAPMSFGANDSPAHEVWLKYFTAHGVPIPDGQIGISPLGIWLQATAHNETR